MENRGPKLVSLPMGHLIGSKAAPIYDFCYTKNLKFSPSPIIRMQLRGVERSPTGWGGGYFLIKSVSQRKGGIYPKKSNKWDKMFLGSNTANTWKIYLDHCVVHHSRRYCSGKMSLARYYVKGTVTLTFRYGKDDINMGKGK